MLYMLALQWTNVMNLLGAPQCSVTPHLHSQQDTLVLYCFNVSMLGQRHGPWQSIRIAQAQRICYCVLLLQ